MLLAATVSLLLNRLPLMQLLKKSLRLKRYKLYLTFVYRKKNGEKLALGVPLIYCDLMRHLVVAFGSNPHEFLDMTSGSILNQMYESAKKTALFSSYSEDKQSDIHSAFEAFLKFNEYEKALKN